MDKKTSRAIPELLQSSLTRQLADSFSNRSTGDGRKNDCVRRKHEAGGYHGLPSRT
jgi:hypothetical protein